MSDKKYTPGYVEVPGKGTRYRDADGNFYNNHLGKPLNQVGNFFKNLNKNYTNYYDSVADFAGTERRDGTKKGFSALPSLKPSDDVPIDQYPAGVKPQNTSELPALKPGDDVDKKDYPAGVTPGGGGGGGNGRNETRTSPTGVVQTGTQTGLKPMTMEDANSLLSPGFTVQDPYSSNQLPTTSTNLYTKDPSTVTFETGGLEGINTGASQQTLSKDLFASGGAIEFTEATPGMPTSAKIEATQTEGGANLVQSGEKSATDWLNRSVMDNSDENVRRRAAMLDTDVPILQAMRNQEAIQGRVYAGGKHYSVNPNRGQEGESDFMEISAEDARARSFGKMSAEDLKNKYVSGVTEGMKSGELPANIPNLDVESEQPATVSPVDTSTAQPFTIPGDDYQPTSTRRKGGLNLFK